MSVLNGPQLWPIHEALCSPEFGAMQNSVLSDSHPRLFPSSRLSKSFDTSENRR